MKIFRLTLCRAIILNLQNLVERTPETVNQVRREGAKMGRKISRTAMRQSLRALLLLMLMSAALGCSSELDPTQPDGAYYLFRDALLAADGEGVWKHSDEATHLYFQERFEHLGEMDKTIDQFLPQTDHRIARQQSGAILLDEIKDGKGLFLKIFQAKNLADNEAIRIGSDIDELTVNKERTAARVMTRAEQVYLLKKSADSEQWHIMLMESETSKSVEKSLGWLGHNESALQQTVEDLVAEQRQEREAIIAELMKPQAE